MTKAIDKFNKLEEGVLSIINAADIYALHIIAKIRNTEPEKELIKSILSGGKMSVFNVYGGAYKEEELQLLEKEGHFVGIGQQIIVATHTALESYLILKFKEYYKYMCADTSLPLVEETLKRFNFRCLNDFKITYKTFFDIHIPSFDVEYHGAHGCYFHPKDSWEALSLIYEARNQIVHEGDLSTYQVSTLMDSWYPFDFTRRWVSLFDTNFDFFIYQKRKTNLYLEYEKRAKQNEMVKTKRGENKDARGATNRGKMKY